MKKQIFLVLAWSLLLAAACTKQRSINEEGNLVPVTVDGNSALPAISVNGTRLHSEAFGNPSDPMLVVLHGGPGSDYRYLLNNCKEFSSRGYYVVFYDQRGSGLSRRHPKNSYTSQTMVEDLDAVIAHYKSSPSQEVFLLGHSWGAILATDYVNRYPAAIRGLVLAEPGGLKWPDIRDYVSRANDFHFTSELFNDAVYADQFLAARSENNHALLDYKMGLLAASDGSADSPLGNEGMVPFWRHGAVVNAALFDLGKSQNPDFTTHLANYTTKVLFVYSERNRAYGVAYAQRVASAFPNVELFQVNGAGHDMLSFATGWQNFFPEALAYFDSLR